MTNSLADIVVKATPGPWETDGPEIIIGDAMGYPIQVAEVVDGGGMASLAQLDADAQLIALAPTLATLVLEAREALAELIGEELGGDQREPSQREETDFYRPVLSWAARRRARATLAKLESL